MTRSITLFVTVAGLALALAVPAAFGKVQPFDQGRTSDTNTPIVSPDAVDRAVAARQAQQAASSTYPDVVDRAVAAREESAGRTLNFDNYKIDDPTTVIVARPTSSGEELEWPQLGIGFGIGLLLALGLGLALRMMDIRPLAH